MDNADGSDEDDYEDEYDDEEEEGDAYNDREDEDGDGGDEEEVNFNMMRMIRRGRIMRMVLIMIIRMTVLNDDDVHDHLDFNDNIKNITLSSCVFVL